MNDEPEHEHPPNHPVKLEHTAYILPNLRMKEELLDVKGPLYQDINVENPAGVVPIIGMKQEFVKFEDLPTEPFNVESPSEIPTITAVKEELLDIKEETGLFHPMVVYGDDAEDEFNTDNNIIKLKDGSVEDLMSLCEEETIVNNTDLNTTSSPHSGMQDALNANPTSLSNCEIPNVHQYSVDMDKKQMCKKRKTSTVQSTASKVLYSCDTCHKCFNKLSNFKRHNIIHTGSKPYTCDTCHKSFSQLNNLKRHERIHTGSNPYTCETCQKSFSELSSFKRHNRIHTGSKPYTCDTCHKCFSHLCTLKSHIRIHTGSKPYSCEACRKCFSRLSTLKKHSRIHTDSKL